MSRHGALFTTGPFYKPRGKFLLPACAKAIVFCPSRQRKILKIATNQKSVVLAARVRDSCGIPHLDKNEQLTIQGDVRNGEVLFNLPVFKNNRLSVTAGSLNNDSGVVTLSPTDGAVTVRWKNPVATTADLRERAQI